MSRVVAVTPLLSYSWLQYLLRLSAQDLINRNFQRRFLAECLPRLAEIKYANAPIELNDKYIEATLIPRNRAQFRFLLPISIVALLRSVGSKLRMIASPFMKPKETSKEIDFWSGIVNRRDSTNRRLEVSGVTFELGSDAPVGVAGCFSALEQTDAYLKDVLSRAAFD